MHTSMFLVFSLLATSACLTSAANAQSGKEPAPFVFHAEETDLRTLVDRCAAYLQRNILFANEDAVPKGLPQQVALQQPIATDRKGCEDMLSQLLGRAGLALTYVDQEGKLLEVISMHGARQQDIYQRAHIRSVEEVLARPNLRVPVLVILELEHTNVQIAQNSLRPFFATSGNNRSGLVIGTMGNESALLMMGFQDMVAQAVRMAKAADVPSSKPPQEWREQIRHLTAQVEALKIRLDALAPQRETK